MEAGNLGLPEFHLLSAFPSSRQPRDHSAQMGLWHPPQLLGLLLGSAPGPVGGAMKLALGGIEHQDSQMRDLELGPRVSVPSPRPKHRPGTRIHLSKGLGTPLHLIPSKV